MRFELTGRHLEITPALRRLVDTKLARLERLLNNTALSARTVLTRDKYRLHVDITLHARGENFLHGVGSSGVWETSVDRAIDKIAQQAQKLKGKWQERKRRAPRRSGNGEGEPAIAPARRRRAELPAAASGATGGEPPTRMPRILRASRQAIKSMSVAEAARAMDPGGDDLLVFHDPERAAISVLYRRNGELLLVETET